MQFSLSKAWNDAIAMISANREVVLIVAGVFFFLPGFLSSFVMEGSQDLSSIIDPASQEQVAELMSKYWWVVLLSLVGQAVGTFSLLALLRSADKPTVGEAIQGSFRCIASAFLIYVALVILVSLIAGVLVAAAVASGSTLVGSILGAIALAAVVYALVRVSLVAPVLAIEKVLNPVSAIKRSLALTKGHSARLFAFYMLLTVAYVIIAIPLVLIIGGLGLILGEAGALLIASLTSALLGAVLAAIYVAIQAAIHRQLAQDRPHNTAGFQFD